MEEPIQMRIVERTITDSIDLAIQAMHRYYMLSDIEEPLIDANCNMLSRIIDYCEKNSIPFDNGPRVWLSEARKALKYPAVGEALLLDFCG